MTTSTESCRKVFVVVEVDEATGVRRVLRETLSRKTAERACTLRKNALYIRGIKGKTVEVVEKG